MKIFVTGATGVIGRRAVRDLVKAGHQVTATARSQEKAELVRAVGGDPVEVDLFDQASLGRVIDGHEVVVNLATKIPPPSKAAMASSWAESHRLRTEGSRNLVDVALATGVRRFVQESIAFIYPDSADRWLDEDVALDPPELALANQEAENQALRFGESGGESVVLRFGQFYAADSIHSRYMCRMARFRLPSLPGPKDAYSPAIAADDAAAAVVAALDVGSGVWNVCDDEPLTRRAYNRAIADALGYKPPIGTGSSLMRLSKNTVFYLRSQRVSNRRFKQASGWAPVYPDARVGWQALVAEMKALG